MSSIRWTQKTIDDKIAAGTIRAARDPLASKTDKKKKRSKYGSTKKEVDSVLFDSKKEACRYIDLKFLQKIGEVSQLRLQVVYQLSVCKYIADFVYRDKTGAEVVEDVKSKQTRALPVYRLKKKMMKAELGIDIKEV